MQNIVGKVIGLSVLITVIVGWGNFSLIGSIGHGDAQSMVALISILFLGLSLTSSLGLMLSQKWAPLAFYPLAVVATVFFSTSLIPGVTHLLPTEMRSWAMVLINLCLLVTVALIHKEQSNSTKQVT